MIRLSVQVSRVHAAAPAKRRTPTVVLRPLGYPAIQIFFHADPIEDLAVRIAKTTEAGTGGEPVGAPVRSGPDGVARIECFLRDHMLDVTM